jgi:hypothetical protein
MASPAQDLKKLRANSAAATGELREFLSRMRGRSAAEVLDCVSSSGLFKGLISASIAMLVLIAVLTVGPYFWSQISGGESSDTAATADAESQAPAADATSETATAPADGASPAATVAPATDPLAPTTPPAGAADTLGIGETKQAPLDVNPLESSTDDLLKGLD